MPAWALEIGTFFLRTETERRWVRSAFARYISPAVVERLHVEVTKIMRSDEMKAKFADLGAASIGSTPAEFATFLRAEMAKWAEVVKTANIRIE